MTDDRAFFGRAVPLPPERRGPDAGPQFCNRTCSSQLFLPTIAGFVQVNFEQYSYAGEMTINQVLNSGGTYDTEGINLGAMNRTGNCAARRNLLSAASLHAL